MSNKKDKREIKEQYSNPEVARDILAHIHELECNLFLLRGHIDPTAGIVDINPSAKLLLGTGRTLDSIRTLLVKFL